MAFECSLPLGCLFTNLAGEVACIELLGDWLDHRGREGVQGPVGHVCTLNY